MRVIKILDASKDISVLSRFKGRKRGVKIEQAIPDKLQLEKCERGCSEEGKQKSCEIKEQFWREPFNKVFGRKRLHRVNKQEKHNAASAEREQHEADWEVFQVAEGVIGWVRNSKLILFSIDWMIDW